MIEPLFDTPAWKARASKLFLWMIPGEPRVFPLGELDLAKAWVAGDGG